MPKKVLLFQEIELLINGNHFLRFLDICKMRIFILTLQLYHINVNSCLGILFQVLLFLHLGLRILHTRYVTCFLPHAHLSSLIISIFQFLVILN